jgi:lipid II:glycine glycyltransferase (peptidoglycan interpeptide bridge formation enzyme)
MKNPCQNVPKPSLFHERWWLAAATGGRFSEVEERQGNYLAGRLPFVVVRKRGVRTICMPPFTHLLGPLVNSGDGKLQTRMMNRLSTVRSLIDQLPAFDFFKQSIDPSIDDGLALIDGLAFQDRGFQVSHQYTFQIDCRDDLEILMAGMHFKVRQHIRRAEEKCKIITIDDPQRFISFYSNNLEKANRTSYMNLDQYPALFSECRARNCGVILAAVLPGGVPAAMTYLVWGGGVMYYLMTTRAPDVQDNGSVNLLIWSAMKRAHELGLLFDLDGVTTSGTARFLSGFGGSVKTRLTVTASRRFFNVVESLKTIVRGGRSVPFSFS